MGKSLSYRCGVRDTYVAFATVGQDNAITYSTPEVLGGTASLSISVETGSNKVYESDLMIRNTQKVAGATVTLESRSVSLANKMRLIDNTITAADAEGNEFEENTTHQAPQIAVGWAAPTTDGSFICTWMLWATASFGDESYESYDGSEKTPTDKIVFGCTPDPNTGVLRRVKKCANETEMNAFFSSVKPA